MKNFNFKKFLTDYYLYIIIFFIFFIIGIFVPVAGDDWEISSWYNKNGLLNLLAQSIGCWKYFNGRILNNFFDMLLSKYPILWAFTSATIHSLTIYICLKLFKLEKDKKSIILFLISVLSVSLGIRRELHIHKVCNISYSIPAFIIFTNIYLLLNNKKSDYNNFDKFIIFMLSLASCLWIENLTLSITIISILILIYKFIKEKKVDKYTLSAVLGCLVGCVILFSSPGFLNRYSAETGDLTTIQLIKMNLPKILFNITLNEKLILLIYAIVGYVLLKQLKKHKIFKFYYILLIIYLISYILLEIFSAYFSEINRIYLIFYKYFVDVNSIFTILIIISILLSIFISILLLTTSKEDKEKLIFLYLLAMLSVGPMVLAPGERNLILLIYVLIIVIVYLFSKINIKKENKKYLYAIFIIVLIFRLEDYHYILSKAHKVELERLHIISNFKNNYSKENNTLILPAYDENIVDNGNSNYYDEAVKKYYFLDNDTTIIYKDKFSFKEFSVSENKLEVILLGEGDFNYNIKILDDKNKVLYKYNGDSNIVEYQFENNKIYTVQAKISKDSDYTIINKKVEVNYE